MDTNGIDGVNRFLKKLWGLFEKADLSADTDMTKEEKKAVHKLIKKISDDIENFSFNTSVAAFMIAVNDLTALKSTNRKAVDVIARLIAPFAPHIAEEFWHRLGHEGSVVDSEWPVFDASALVEDTVKYPVSFNGKTRFMIEAPAGASKDDVQAIALADTNATRWLDGKTPKKIIVVPNKIVNIVI